MAAFTLGTACGSQSTIPSGGHQVYPDGCTGKQRVYSFTKSWLQDSQMFVMVGAEPLKAEALKAFEFIPKVSAAKRGGTATR